MTDGLVTGAAGQLPGQQADASGYNQNPPSASTGDLNQITSKKTRAIQIYPDKPPLVMDFEIVDAESFTVEQDYLESETKITKRIKREEPMPTKSLQISVKPGDAPIQLSFEVVQAESDDEDEDLEISYGTVTDPSQLPSSASAQTPPPVIHRDNNQLPNSGVPPGQ